MVDTASRNSGFIYIVLHQHVLTTSRRDQESHLVRSHSIHPVATFLYSPAGIALMIESDLIGKNGFPPRSGKFLRRFAVAYSIMLSLKSLNKRWPASIQR